MVMVDVCKKAGLSNTNNNRESVNRESRIRRNFRCWLPFVILRFIRDFYHGRDSAKSGFRRDSRLTIDNSRLRFTIDDCSRELILVSRE